MNSNQYSSLPHTQGGVGNRGQTYHNNGGNNSTSNTRNYKKKNNKKYRGNNNNQNNNQQFNNVNSQYNNYNSQQDYGCTSLPHSQLSNNYNNRYSNQYQQSFNKFTTSPSPDLNSFGNNVPVPKQTKKNRHKRGGGSNNNYRNTGLYESDRLNKSLNKENTLDSSFEISSGISTSISLDNIKSISSKNAEKSPLKITNSYSFNNSSNSTKLTEVEVIQEIVENENSTFTHIDSGLSSVDSNSYCSMPVDSNKNTQLAQEFLSSIEGEEESISQNKSSLSVSSSSQNSPNQNGYETAISQIASEAEVSFGYDSMNIETTITKTQIETELIDQIKPNALEELSQSASLEENKIENETNVKLLTEKDGSMNSDDISNSSINETEMAQNSENTIIEPTEKAVFAEITKSEKQQKEVSNEYNSKLMTEASVEYSCEELNKENDLYNLKFAEQEVNDLVNKIVHDVISQAIQISPIEEVLDISKEEPNFKSLEQEVNQLEKSEIDSEDKHEVSFIDNDNSIVYGKSDFEVIENSEEAMVDSTITVLNKTEKVLTNSKDSISIKNKNITKEPPVDCFSCTIS